MTKRLAAWTAIATMSVILPDAARLAFSLDIAAAASEVYIRQARGRVTPGASILTKPTPETTSTTSTVAPAAAPTAPETCNAQNASSQACYTATQQTRPAGR